MSGYTVAPPEEPIEAIRREAALVGRYQVWLTKAKHSFGRNRVRIPDEVAALYTDLFDKTNGELIEAKASASRASVRVGLGQLLDYARFVPHDRPSICRDMRRGRGRSGARLARRFGVNALALRHATHDVDPPT